MFTTYPNAVDVHTHLDFPSLEEDRNAICTRARRAGVDSWVISGADPGNWDRVRRVALETGGLAVLGVHPWWANTIPPQEVGHIVDVLAKHHPIHGIGEIGLDFHRARTSEERTHQIHLLRAQLNLARTLDAPVVLHCVRAHSALLDLLANDGLPNAGGLVHGWNGSLPLTRRACDLGLHLSFGPQVTRPMAKRARAAAIEVPHHRLLIETDCPDQPLEGHTRGQPADLIMVANEVAILRQTSPADILNTTGTNARRLFPGLRHKPM